MRGESTWMAHTFQTRMAGDVTNSKACVACQETIKDDVQRPDINPGTSCAAASPGTHNLLSHRKSP